jgi:hypothetical protein
MPRGVNTAFHPARVVNTPTPDGGADPDTAGPIIQANWERLRDSGMSATEATTRLHTLTPTVSTSSHRAPAEGTSPSWLNSQQMPTAPNNASMHGPTIPRTVAAPNRDGTAATYEIGPRYTNSYGPVADILNRRQPTLA